MSDGSLKIQVHEPWWEGRGKGVEWLDEVPDDVAITKGSGFCAVEPHRYLRRERSVF